MGLCGHRSRRKNVKPVLSILESEGEGSKVQLLLRHSMWLHATTHYMKFADESMLVLTYKGMKNG